MTQHPLSDEILEQFGLIDDQCVEGERIFFDDDMRAAYDRGRESALEALDRLYTENSEGLRRLAQEDNS
jgi:hypothetical protein